MLCPLRHAVRGSVHVFKGSWTCIPFTYIHYICGHLVFSRIVSNRISIVWCTYTERWCLLPYFWQREVAEWVFGILSIVTRCFGKKVAQNFVKFSTIKFPLKNMAPTVWLYFIIFVKCGKEKNSSAGENSPNLVTLILGPDPRRLFRRPVAILEHALS
jgi:hypothetical protein